MQEKICPYPGLRPFNEEESIFFKGREVQIERIAKRIGEKKFLMINGASGDGKSSLMYAGVIPYAKAGFFKAQFDNWLVVNFRPERKPLSNFTVAFCKELQLPDQAHVEKQFGYGFSALLDLYKASTYYVDESSPKWLNAVDAEKKAQKRKAANLLILVDQFEEFFTNSDNFPNGIPSEGSIKTVNLILETYKISVSQDLPVYVVCTMRSDYIGQCAAFRGLPEAIGYSQFFVPRLKRQELEQVIEGSAQLSGGTVSKSLVQYLLNHTGEGFDQLPILQHALNKMWKIADNGNQEIGKIHLAKVGGISPKLLSISEKKEYEEWFNSLPAYKKKLFEKPSLNNILNAHANELLEFLPEYYYTATQKKISRETVDHIVKVSFQCLTVIDKGIAVRRITNLAEITSIINDYNIQESDVDVVLSIFRLQGNTLIEPFVNDDHTNLKLNADTVIDITHESLIRNWDVLSEWATEEFDNYNTWLDIEKQFQRWLVSKESESYLLAQGPLSYFYNWNDLFKPNKFWLATYDESKKEQEEKLALAETKIIGLNRFLSQSRRAIRQKRNFTRSLAAAAFIILSMFTFWSLIERQKALAQEKLANQKTLEAEKSKEVALVNKRIAEWQQNKALQYGQVAEKEKNKALRAKDASDRAKQEALMAKIVAEQEKLRAEQQTVLATLEAEKAEKNRTIAIDLYEKATTAEQKAKQLTLASLAQNLAFKSTQVENDNELQGLLALQAYNFTLQNNQNVQDPVIYEALRAYYTKFHHPKGILFGSKYGSHSFSFREPKSLALLKNQGSTNSPNQIVCAGRLDTAAYYSEDGEFIMKKGIAVPAGKDNLTKIFLLLSPDATKIINGYRDGTILLSQLSNASNQTSFTQVISTKYEMISAAYNSSGSALVYAKQDSTINYGAFEKNTFKELGHFKSIGITSALAISPSGLIIYYGTTSGEIIKYDITTNQAQTIYKTKIGNALCLAPLNKKNALIIGCSNGKILYIELSTNITTTLLDLGTIPIENITFNPSETLLAASIADKSIRVFDLVNNYAKPIVLKNQNDKVRCLLFINDSKLMAGGSVGRMIWDWELSSSKLADNLYSNLSRNLTIDEWEKYVGKDIDYQKTREIVK